MESVPPKSWYQAPERQGDPSASQNYYTFRISKTESAQWNEAFEVLHLGYVQKMCLPEKEVKKWLDIGTFETFFLQK